MARNLLASNPPSPASPKLRTDLTVLALDAATRGKLESGGVRDVEGVLEVGPAKLAQIVGNRATATRLAESARKALGTAAPAPEPAPRSPRGAAKSTARKKPK